MLKVLALSSWAIAITLVVFYLQSPFSSTAPSSTIVKSELEKRKTNTFSIAVFEKGNVVGHFATRVQYQIPKNAEASFPISIDYLIGDSLYELIHGIPTQNLNRLTHDEIQEMEVELVKLLNSRTTPVPVANVRFENSQLLLK